MKNHDFPSYRKVKHLMSKLEMAIKAVQKRIDHPIDEDGIHRLIKRVMRWYGLDDRFYDEIHQEISRILEHQRGKQ